jgi:protein-S-isoprenylcysteine O-methyltransferase Ste14
MSYSKFRLSRGPLRWWIMLCGLLFADVSAARFMAGLAIIAAGTAIHVWSKASLWQNRQLSQDGPYRFSRNPFYVANLFIDGGLLLVIGRWWVALPALVAWWWVYRRTIRAEEATLAELFGEQFTNYCRCVPKFFPRPWRYLRSIEVQGPRTSWSNQNLTTGAEWTRACRAMLCPWLLLAASILLQLGWEAIDSLAFNAALGAVLAWFFLGATLPTWRRQLAAATQPSP